MYFRENISIYENKDVVKESGGAKKKNQFTPIFLDKRVGFINMNLRGDFGEVDLELLLWTVVISNQLLLLPSIMSREN